MKMRVLAGAAALSFAGLSPAMGQVQCESDIVAKLDELRVDRSAVASLYTQVNRTTEGRDTSNGMTGWVGLRNCRGGVVFNISSNCTVYEAYTRGECRLAGVRSH